MFRRFFSLLLGLLLAMNGWGEEALSVNASSSPPDLQHLSTDWWQYIGQAGDQQEQRLRDLLKQVERLRGIDVEMRRSELQQAAETYLAGLQKKNPPELSAAPLAVHGQYNLEELFSLDDQLQALKSDLLAKQSQLSELDRKISGLDSGLQQTKLRYINLPDNDPARIGVALEWVTQQLRLASFRNEQALRQETLESLKQEAAALQGGLNDASGHLQPAAQEVVAGAVQQLAAVRQQEGSLQSQLDALELESLAATDITPQGQARSRLLVQKLLNLQAQQASAQFQALNLQAQIYLEQLLANDFGSGFKDMREFLRDARVQLIQMPEKLQRWRQQGSFEPERAADGQLVVAQGEEGKLVRQVATLADETLGLLDGLDKSLARNRLLLDLLGRQLLKSQGGAKAAVSAVADTAGNVVQLSLDSLHRPLFEINETPITVISILRFLVILLLAWIVSTILRGMLRRVARSQGEEYTGSLFVVRRVLHYAIVILGFMIGLSSIGIDVSKFALIATALSIGIGFGLQNIINNFVSGIIMLFEKSLKIGDFVELESGARGGVREMRVRSTVIATNDNISIVVPNSEFVSGRVVNWTMREAYRRIRVPFGVAYGTDKELVRKAVLEAAERVPYTLQHPTRAPQVWLVGFGDSALNFELVVWLTPDAVKRPSFVHACYCWEIDTSLSQYGIEIPFPQRDLHIRTTVGLENRPEPPLPST
ncbi:mechanosensitive ion channel domain-containing protein [Candidatus Thiothrix sp. Deng01]|uniref:Mechanosensitive ion channel domain-containing protein n=1 Tax=Candidatus Thiothrix phosphatis TaxID=3112415 RepID=A0ABU6D063_9GAMM|nr:mechanosensitive ion channel domain-containing protein [Candidatus Thiothrix sp. Deng01]MEB4592221.1 mechanosensitive ion channel domain-containing protein [Candidatus Thiothrix sp. Deng01]